MARSFVAIAALLAVAVMQADACIWIYGKAKDTLNPPGDKYTFATQGLDWTGTCATGVEQSPIDFPKAGNSGYASKAPRTEFMFPDLVADGENLVVINTGHNIQVQWGEMEYGAEIHVPHRGAADSTIHDVLDYPAEDITAMAKGYPIQFHIHTKSEHTMAGTYYPLELHIVTVVPESEMRGCDGVCIAPVGILFKEVEGMDNPVVDQILKYASMREGEAVLMPEGERIDLSELFPAGGDGKYLQYKGGLTTPPCQEGFLWHVFTQESYVSVAQMNRIMELMSFKECDMVNETMAMRKLASKDDGLKKFMLPEEQITRRSTFTHPATDAPVTGRALLDGHEEEGEYMCKPYAYGYNNRRVMPIGERKIMRYAKA